jgi:hypothetical protein
MNRRGSLRAEAGGQKRGAVMATVRGGVLALAALTLLSTVALAAEAPRISVVEQRYDFGTVAPGSVLVHVFEITNTGQAVLEIQKVQPS